MLKNKNRSFIVMLVSDYTLIMCKRYNKLIHSNTEYHVTMNILLSVTNIECRL